MSNGTESPQVLNSEDHKELQAYRRLFAHLFPERNPGSYFISGEGGKKDQNGLPEFIHVCPAYGCDWTAAYKRV